MRETSPRRRRRRARMRGQLRRGVVLEPSVVAEELRGAREQSVEGGQPFALRREDGAVRFRERAANGVGGARRADDGPEVFRRARCRPMLSSASSEGPISSRPARGSLPWRIWKAEASDGLGEERRPRSKPRAPGPETEPPPFRAAFGPERKRAGGRRRTRAHRSRRRLRSPVVTASLAAPPTACGASSCEPGSSCAFSWRSAFRSAAASSVRRGFRIFRTFS